MRFCFTLDAEVTEKLKRIQEKFPYSRSRLINMILSQWDEKSVPAYGSLPAITDGITATSTGITKSKVEPPKQEPPNQEPPKSAYRLMIDKACDGAMAKRKKELDNMVPLGQLEDGLDG